MRWLYHLRLAVPADASPGERYAPPSLVAEGFIHASYKDAVAESGRLYFPEGAPVEVLRIDPRRLDVPVEVVATPRGEMPHIHGSIPPDAVVEELPLPVFLARHASLPDDL